MAVDADDLANTLLDAEYEGVRFPVSECPSTGGHQGAEHEAHGRDGSDCESTKAKAYKGKLVCPMINGTEGFDGIELYPTQYLALLDMLAQKPIGELTHPLLGRVVAWMHDWEIQPSADVRNGLTLTIEWTEHRATAQVFVGRSGERPTDSVTALVGRADAADAAMADAMPAGGYTLTRPVVDDQLDVLAGADAGQVSSASRAVSDVCTLNLALPGLSDATANTAVLALERLRTAALSIEASRNRGLARANRYRVPATMPLALIANAVYGDASKVGLIRSANPGLIDPLFVAAGTEIITPQVGA